MLGERIRFRRTELHMTRNELAEKLHVAPSSIANYENGGSCPKTDIFISLLEVLQVDANYLYQDYLLNSKVRSLYGRELTAVEEQVLVKYRHLSENGKRMVRMVIEEEYRRQSGDDWIEYPCLQPGLRKLNCGFLLYPESTKVFFEKKYAYEGMEFCLQIRASQYEPIYKKDTVLALKKEAAKHNEIGLFRLNGVYYLRALYKVRKDCKLCALSVTEPDIEITAQDQFECIGKVLGPISGISEIVSDQDPDKGTEKERK